MTPIPGMGARYRNRAAVIRALPIVFRDIMQTTAAFAAKQKAMRHSDINLTMRYYTHLTTEDQRNALERLPPMDVGIEPSANKPDDLPETDQKNGPKNGLE